jgi:hypothetical protein
MAKKQNQSIGAAEIVADSPAVTPIPGPPAVTTRQYRVYKPIQYRNVMYYPLGYLGIDPKTRIPFPAPEGMMVKSGHDGQPIPVNMSGIIELPDNVAKDLNLGQIAPLEDPENPDVSGYREIAEGLVKQQVKKGIEDKITVEGKDDWVVGAPRTVTPLGPHGTLNVG